MGKKANPVYIGLFVVAAIVIAVAAIVLLGASSFKKSEIAVCYFKDSINGLNVGAPVKYKGVEIGKVKNISMDLAMDSRENMIVVFLDIDADLGVSEDWIEFVKEQRRRGLRAKLNFQSIVTGMLYVELDYFADIDEQFSIRHENDSLVEIPVMESSLSDMAKKVEALIENVSKVDFKKIADDADALLVSINSKLGDIDAKAINSEVLATLESVRKVVSDEKILKSLENLNGLISDGRDFFTSTSKTVEDLNSNVSETLSSLNRFVENVNTIVEPNSAVRYEVSMLIRNVSDAAISIKSLTDFLERNPKAILTGKRVKGE
ncbi:MAG: MCE family protein [Opitutales bacterium]|nr:MCE family protein [Opitutales bacterium]